MSRDGGSGARGVDPQQLWLSPAHARRGRRPTFSREEITTAAVALADAEGLEAVTMRRVAAQVGAGVMTLRRSRSAGAKQPNDLSGTERERLNRLLVDDPESGGGRP